MQEIIWKMQIKLQKNSWQFQELHGSKQYEVLMPNEEIRKSLRESLRKSLEKG